MAAPVASWRGQMTPHEAMDVEKWLPHWPMGAPKCPLSLVHGIGQLASLTNCVETASYLSLTYLSRDHEHSKGIHDYSVRIFLSVWVIQIVQVLLSEWSSTETNN